MSNPLDHIRIVLIEPKEPGNIGAVARAMKNTGLSYLYLVNPPDHTSGTARAMAHGSGDILYGATVVASLSEALEDVSLAVGTSHRKRREFDIVHPPPNRDRQTVIPSQKPQRSHCLWPRRKRTDQQRNPTVSANLPHPLGSALSLPQPIASHPHLWLRTLSRNPFRSTLQTIRTRPGYAPRTRIHV